MVRPRPRVVLTLPLPATHRLRHVAPHTPYTGKGLTSEQSQSLSIRKINQVAFLSQAVDVDVQNQTKRKHIGCCRRYLQLPSGVNGVQLQKQHTHTLRRYLVNHSQLRQSARARRTATI